jgi:hypothetical protein
MLQLLIPQVPCNSTAIAPSITFEFNGPDGQQNNVVLNPADYIVPVSEVGILPT